MTRLTVLVAWLLLIASPVAAQTTTSPVPAVPAPSNSTAAPVPTVPPERIAPPTRTPGEAGPVGGTPFSGGPPTTGITGGGGLAGSDTVNPQYGTSSDRPVPGH